jgi:hypothetical protein
MYDRSRELPYLSNVGHRLAVLISMSGFINGPARSCPTSLRYHFEKSVVSVVVTLVPGLQL